MTKIDNKEIKNLENLYKLNKLKELKEEVEKLLKTEKDNIVLLNILGVVFLKKSLFKEAELNFKKILDKDPQNSNALKNLGEISRKSKKFSDAIKYYNLYLKKNLKDANVINNLALCYLKNKRYELSIKLYRDLIKNEPHNEEYLANLAFALVASLDFEEGIRIFETILNKNIHNWRVYSGYLFNQNYNLNSDLNKTNEYIKKFNQSYKKEKINIVDFSFEKKPKKIRIGFISPDFRKHPVGYAILNVIKKLKSYNFDLFGYYNFYLEDELTINFKNYFNKFYHIENLKEEKIINLIRNDGIHILIDLAGHTNNNNLNIFYYYPAPIQVSWLGYLPTTGISEIKYKIGDKQIYSKKNESNFSEKILMLPDIWSNFEVFQNADIPYNFINNKNNKIILGSFVTLRKVNDNVINLWSKVLKRFPNTILYLKAPELHDDSVKRKIVKKFNNFEISTERLILEKSSDYKNYLESYLKVHITLDPFPWNGVTTSFESVWMGAPIFCLKGDTVYSRCAYSINKNLKMDDWIANDQDDYLKKLEKILSNKNQLLSIKKNLRENAIKNNLFNSEKFTKNLSIKLNEIWNDFEKKELLK